jgi:4-hydroxy-3-polyprenylbenzoate decarboxylase
LQRIIIGITGASGAVLGVRTLEAFAAAGVETHLVVSRWGQQTLEHETGLKLDDLRERATAVYGAGDMGAAISSGSFRTMGMAIVPCSMHSLAAISLGMGENLVHRAADVVLKERLPLVLVPRETPLNDIHLENMLRLSRMGVRIVPPNPAFYNHPESIADVVAHIVARVLDQFAVASDYAGRWQGEMRRTRQS